MSIDKAAQLLQEAYSASLRGEQYRRIDLLEELKEIGVINPHYAYYNSGLSAHPDVREELQRNPGGPLALLLTLLCEIRLQSGDYSEETLRRMYGLPTRIRGTIILGSIH